ncbi:complement C1q-like protein 2 [Saccostrea cucullata]|uniref:complement C1q-like protein 2 n=1 Tax=Saccostrea cuccullata TaxID=36930 RepID=UPI002ED1F41D
MAPLKFMHVHEVVLCFLLFAFSCCSASHANEDSNVQFQITIMQKTLTILQETVERQNIRISKLENDNRRQEDNIRKLLMVIQNCGIEENNDVKSVNESTPTSITENHQNPQIRGPERNSMIKRLLTQASSSPPSSQDHVAFYARMSITEKVPSGHHILVFDNVVTNFGNGYNGVDGIFTAPKDGVYVFIWVIRLHEAQHSTQLMINNVEYGSTHLRAMNNDDGSVSGNVVAHVNKGDVVFVRVYPYNGYTGSGDILSNIHGKPSFSGWFLQ